MTSPVLGLNWPVHLEYEFVELPVDQVSPTYWSQSTPRATQITQWRKQFGRTVGVVIPRGDSRPGAPLENSALHREFAFGPGSIESLLEFAHNSGLPGGVTEVRVESERGRPATRGAEVGAWRSEMVVMREALDLSDAARDGDVARLQQAIKWQSGVPVYRRHGAATFEPLLTPHLEEDLRSFLSPDDLRWPARIASMRIFNARTTWAVSPRLHLDRSVLGMSFQLESRSLLEGLWLQCALAVSAATRYRRCQCGRWMEISVGGTGRNKQSKFCSDACRFRAYRDRKAAAVELNLQGVPAKQIAERLNVELASVKRWLGEAKRK